MKGGGKWDGMGAMRSDRAVCILILKAVTQISTCSKMNRTLKIHIIQYCYILIFLKVDKQMLLPENFLVFD